MEDNKWYPLHRFGYLFTDQDKSDALIRETAQFIRVNKPDSPSLLLRQLNEDVDGSGEFPWSGELCTALRCMGGNVYIDLVQQQWHSVMDCIAILMSVQFIVLMKISEDLRNIRDEGFVTHLELAIRMTLKCRIDNSREIIKNFKQLDTGDIGLRRVLSRYFFTEYIREWELCYAKLHGVIYEVIRNSIATGSVKFNPEKLPFYQSSSPVTEMNKMLELDIERSFFTIKIYLNPEPNMDIGKLVNTRLYELQCHQQTEFLMNDFDRIRGMGGRFNLIALSTKHKIRRDDDDNEKKQRTTDVEMGQDIPSDVQDITMQ
jgi:hypothetical protein